MTATPTHVVDGHEFRLDINALRAWAVVAVVLFHFAVPGFTGGFVGVDVFYVISGYLMTRIIMEGVERDGPRFSIARFYFARARRIIPALLALVFILCVAGWFLLASSDYRILGGHAVHAALFDSNIRFWSEAGYFDTASSEKWLLHTWSLSVEWQFYLALPLFIALGWRLWPKQRAIVAMYVIGFALSLTVSVWLANTDTSAAFYLIQSRAWEMLAGGLAWFAKHRYTFTAPQKRGLLAVGYGAILFAIFFFEGDMLWPGFAALVPVLGCALVLAARQTSGLLVDNAPLQWLGTRSYSIYLWHWPVVVLPIYFNWDRDLPLLLGSLALVLLLGDLSWRFTEERTRRLINRLGNKRGAIAIVVAMLLVVGVAASIKLTHGFPSRLSPAVAAIEQEVDNINPNRERCHGGGGNKTPDCILGGPGIAAIMLGDSHASAIVTALQAAAPDPSMGVLALSYTSCPSIAGVRKIDPNHGCSAFNEWAFARIKQLPSTVPLVIANRTTNYLFGEYGNDPLTTPPDIYFDRPHDTPDAAFLAQARTHLLDTWCTLARERPLYLVQPLPEMPRKVPDAMARGLMHGHRVQIVLDEEAYRERHAWVRGVQEEAAQQCGVHLLDPVPLLCASGVCPGDSDGRPRYSDAHHLNEFGNRLLLPMFRPVFGKQVFAGSVRP